tara:strand:+ start:119 stop:268 length:150 start_codon:yes stop_codon:yes gene_type:complete
LGSNLQQLSLVYKLQGLFCGHGVIGGGPGGVGGGGVGFGLGEFLHSCDS